MCGLLLRLVCRFLVPDSALAIRSYACLGDIRGLTFALDPTLTVEEWDRPLRYWWVR